MKNEKAEIIRKVTAVTAAVLLAAITLTVRAVADSGEETFDGMATDENPRTSVITTETTQGTDVTVATDETEGQERCEAPCLLMELPEHTAETGGEAPEETENETEKTEEAPEETENETEKTFPVSERVLEFNPDDDYIMLKIAMAEAEGEDVKGKALVMNVIINRMDSADFPDTVSGVVFQDGQFTPCRNGRYDRVTPDRGCFEALEMVKNGFDESRGALYFRTVKNAPTWHSENLETLFTHGCHTFYR